MSLVRSLVAPNVRFSGWVLATDKFILLSSRIDRNIDMRALVSDTRSWSYCKRWNSKRDFSK